GRMRQLNQFGMKVIGRQDQSINTEVIDLAMRCYEELGLKSLKLVINSLGDKESRTHYREALVDHFTPVKGELCEDCRHRIQTNPLRILDCKKDRDHPSMKTAPSILEFLNEKYKNYFEKVKEYLTMMDITYEVDPNLVRGLDYYNHTAFEIMSEAKGFGSITTLTGGGRYNGLIEELGGPDTPGIGFGMGIERLLMALEAEEIDIIQENQLDAYVVAVGSDAEKEAVRLVHTLRKNGMQVDKDYQNRKMRAQFKAADRYSSKFVLIIGENELEKEIINVKEMKTGEQEEVPFENIKDYMQDKLLGGKKDE